ncbi:MAG TPA: PAS domain S-box protein [Bryobacteraceae bacterium]|nr:PAS domain S-box protein [Bryobacteraceae bacterium]
MKHATDNGVDVGEESIGTTSTGWCSPPVGRSTCTTVMLAHALRSVKEAVSITDMQDRILFVNSSFLELYGFREEELVGNSIAMVRSSGNPAESVRDILPATMRGGWQGELWNRRRDGTDLLVFLRTAPVRDESGATIALIGMATDATGQKRMQETLLRSEEMFSKAFDRSPVIGAIASLDDGRYLEVNQAFVERTGYAREEALGRTPVELGVGHDSTGMERLAALLRREKRVQDREITLYTRTGKELIGLLSAEAVEIAGKPCAILTAEDITERRRTEAALRDKEEQFDALSLAAQDAIVMMDSEGDITFWGGAAEKMFGYIRQDALGRKVHELIAPAGYREQSQKAMRPWRETGQGAAVGKVIELEAQRKDGSILPVELSLSSLRIEGRWNAIAIIRDITERKRVETEAREAGQRLSALVETLQAKSRRDSVLSELQEFLQACSTTDEISPVIARSFTKLFPELQGALFLLSPSKTDLEATVTWGGFPDDPDSALFPPDTCWGLRRGRAFWLDDPLDGLVCRHLKHLPASLYVCLPLTAKSEVVGLLHLRMKPGEVGADAQGTFTDLKEMSVAICEMLSLSISNVKLREMLSQQSIRDPLTGLVNRRYLEEGLEREIFRAARLHQSVGVVMADVDHFKQFNDAHGHAAGDIVLVALAKVLKAHFRGIDISSRYGGEEFAVVLADSSLEQSVRRADELREQVKTIVVSHRGALLGPITLSLGVSVFPVHGSNQEDLLNAADAALYQAKREGRDRVVAAR